jgi:imidazolonepropionase-like amidohydrolase
MSAVHRLSTLLATVSLLASSVGAQTPPTSQPTAITSLRLVDDVDAPPVSILLRNGRVERILQSGTELPPGYLLVEGGGGLALPAFLDAYSTAGISTPSPRSEQDAMSGLDGNVHVGMREAARKGLQPSLSAVSVFELSDERLKAYRAQGFAVQHGSPSGEILAGQSVVTSLRTGALRERVLARDVFMAAAFRASGEGYPSTLMGYLSHLRQFVLDAQWHALLMARYSEGRLDRRPPFDPDLEAMSRLLAQEQRLLCRADTARDIRRWLTFAKAQGVLIAISGGREAWKVATELKAAQVPVFLALDWGEEVEDPDEKKEAEVESKEVEGEEQKAAELPPGEPAPAPPDAEPDVTELVDAPVSEDAQSPEAGGASEKPAQGLDDWTYVEPIDLRRERRRLWEEVRDCALRLHESGVEFALCTADGTPQDLLKGVRKLVEVGLPAEVALASLTTDAAAALGLGGRVGKIEAGFDANIAIWSGSPFAKKSKLERLIVDGVLYEYDRDDESQEAPAEGLDLSGTWEVTYSDQTGAPAELALLMQKDGALGGTLSFEMPDGTKSASEVTGRLSGHGVILTGSIEMGAFSAKIRIEGRVEGEGMSGDATWKFSGGEDSNSFTAKRKPESTLGGNS